MASASANDEFVRTSSPSEHAATCHHHVDPRAGLCTALTQKGTPCRYHSKAPEQGFLPTCRTHTYPKTRAGKCQAVEDCGQLCNRLAPSHSPYHFCPKHENGSNTLPCHLLRLPTELRLMIYRYIFPKVVPSTEPHGVKVAVLKLNRLIYQEASSVLYGESHFKAYVGVNRIILQGKSWYRQPSTKRKDNDYSVEQTLCQAGARLIRNLDVAVSVGTKTRCPKGINTRGITHEEQELYMMRDSVRKLVELIMIPSTNPAQYGLNTLKRLHVRPTLESNWGWESAQATIALFFLIEPFQLLRQIKHPLLEAPSAPTFWPSVREIVLKMLARKAYDKGREEWMHIIKNDTTTKASKVQEPDAAVKIGYRRVEAFVQLIYAQDIHSTRDWTSTVFQGIERPMHLARVAYETNNIDALNEIHEAIKMRWINAHRQQQKSLQAIADSINIMFETDSSHSSDDGSLSPRELYPDAFLFEDLKPLKAPFSPSHLWLELNTDDPVPKRGDPGVTITRKGFRQYIKKGGVEWVRLMTPATARQDRML